MVMNRFDRTDRKKKGAWESFTPVSPLPINMKCKSEVRTVMSRVRRRIHNTLNSERGTLNFSMAALIAVLALVMVFGSAGESDAVLVKQNGWTHVETLTGTWGPSNVDQTTSSTFTAGGGSNRLLVCGFTGHNAQGNNYWQFSQNGGNPYLTFGGTSFTQIDRTAAATNARTHVWLGYILEASIPGGAQTLRARFTVDGGSDDVVAIKFFCATFSGVDQASPISFNVNEISSAYDAAEPTPTINFGSTDMPIALFGMTVNNTGGGATFTPAAWDNADKVVDNGTNTNYYGAALVRSTGATGPETITPTWPANARGGVVAAAIAELACTDSVASNLQITVPSSDGTTVNRTVTITATADEAMDNMTVTVAGSSACNVSSASMSGSGPYTYSWDTSACGTASAENPITITVNGDDPECGNPQQDQYTNITIDNRGPFYTLASCGDCHKYPPDDTATRGVPTTTGAVVGDHQKHQFVCSTCHIAPATETSADFAHRDKMITMATSGGAGTEIRGGYYDKSGNDNYNAPDDEWASTNLVTTSTCWNVGCHGTSSETPQWGVGTVTCQNCHGGATDAGDGAPTRREVISEFVGTDQASNYGHLAYDVSSAPNDTLRADCSQCHTEPITNHINNTLDDGRGVGTIINDPPSTAFCLDCHKSGVSAPFADGITPPDIDSTLWSTGTTAGTYGWQSHRDDVTACTDCHGDGSGNTVVHGGSVDNLMKLATQRATCFQNINGGCHNTGSGNAPIQAEIESAATATGGVHSIWGTTTPGSAKLQLTPQSSPACSFDCSNALFVRGWTTASTMVCADCHSQDGSSGGVRGPHGSSYNYILKGADQSAITTATSGRTLGTPRPGTMTWTAFNRENLCINCHASDIYGYGSNTGNEGSNGVLSAHRHGSGADGWWSGNCGEYELPCRG
jgi:hypothetical protein